MSETQSQYGKMADSLMNSVGSYINLETDDGVRREGRLSGWRMRDLVLNGETLTLPVALELNKDPNDTVALDRIKRITVKS